MKGLEFAKMVASGNDFVVIDHRDSKLLEAGHSLPEAAKRLCARRFGIGADGMLLIDLSKRADFMMRVFNPDGSEAEMCGNGCRCAALYAVERGIAPKDMKIETISGIVEAEVVGLRVKLKLTTLKNIRLNKKIKVGKKTYGIHFIDTGVPHVVYFLKKLGNVDVEGLGSKIRFHRAFRPRGTNVNFVKVLNPKEIKIRTYERGVEDETYACGTGAAASAIVSSLIYGLTPHIDVHTKGGEVLRVYFDKRRESIKNVYLEGDARLVYEGRVGYV